MATHNNAFELNADLENQLLMHEDINAIANANAIAIADFDVLHMQYHEEEDKYCNFYNNVQTHLNRHQYETTDPSYNVFIMFANYASYVYTIVIGVPIIVFIVLTFY